MARDLARLAAVALIWTCADGAAFAQKAGGILRMPHGDSPASMSVLEESTIVSEGPMMAVFNNLVVFDQHIAQNSMNTVHPELATSWSWDDAKTTLTFKLRDGVKWHDGKPFTAADVKCTWDLLTEKAPQKLRVNPRKSWWQNVDSVTANGDFEASFHLKRPQPSFVLFLASGWSPVYPCHVPPAQMRQHPVGTGPFKFVEFKPNESIKLVKNPDYWKRDRPYLDGIEYTIIRNQSTWILALGAKQFDRTGPGFIAPALMKEITGAAPEMQCRIDSWNTTRTLITNRHAPPFDNPELRKAIQLALDRSEFIKIIGDGEGSIGATLQPPPDGVWGMPPETLKTLAGYDPDIAKNRAQAREIMQKLGYGPDKHLAVTVTTRNVAAYRDPAVILIGQLKDIWIDGTLNAIDTTQWYPTVMRKDYTVAFTVT
ncbi:MAG: peptide ABC transporter substrate-binding protein, partial [Alphaproteobacteria bacterium]|nr:peptide ABC transporter substrate-binding protein [Alphaproteobacteria bacterium]